MLSQSTTAIDHAHGAFRGSASPLDAFFAPKSVAVIGASERAGSVGRALVWNLISSPFGGTVYPVNPKHTSVLGMRAYRRVAEIPEPVDLALVATPAATVPGVIGECAEARVRGAIIVSAEFRECGPAGTALETEIRERAARGGVRIVGPNCLGIIRPVIGLNASFAASAARAGHIAFVSQSGALGTAILDWSLREGVGFSAFASLGSMLDVGWGDLIDYFGDDPKTRSIVLYMESIDDSRTFLSAAREVALTKPILVLKGGRSEGAARAVLSHTGAMTGHDDVLDAAFRRCGVHRAETIGELFALAEAFEKQPRPNGRRLAIVTNAGGPGVLAADALAAGGGQLAELTSETTAMLSRVLPPFWSKGNPIDVLGDASPERYVQALEAATHDAQNDGVLVILTPQAMTDPTQTAQQVAWHVQHNGKAVLASWMGGAGVAAGRQILASAGIPTFSYPETAVQAFLAMAHYNDTLRGLYETPTLPAEPAEGGPDLVTVASIIEAAHAAGRTLLTEPESKQILAAYGIPVVETRVARNESEAVALADGYGYPVVLKIHSEAVTHKTDVDGVRLGLPHAKAVRASFREIEAAARRRNLPGPFAGVTVQPMVKGGGLELLIGSSVDPQFGPVLLFGSGGILTGVYQDRSIALAPINSTLARRLMERTRIFAALKGTRERGPVDLPALEHLLVRFSRLVTEQPRLKEIDINPLLATSERLLALDARMVLHGAEVPDDRLPRPAIRPYPAQYVAPFVLKDGTTVTIRPIRPEDEPWFVKFHGTLSERSVYYRFFHTSGLDQRTAHERLTRVCFIDYDREMALVAEKAGAEGSAAEIIGVGRLRKIPRTDEAQFAILVADPYQNRGLGTELMRRLMQVGRDEHLHRLESQVLPENREMHRICAKVGGSSYVTGSVVRIEIDLTRPATVAAASKPPFAAGKPAAPVPPTAPAAPAATSLKR